MLVWGRASFLWGLRAVVVCGVAGPDVVGRGRQLRPFQDSTFFESCGM